jgi:hypothetical protein
MRSEFLEKSNYLPQKFLTLPVNNLFFELIF